MLQHLEAGNDVELAGVLAGKRLGRRPLVIDIRPRLDLMKPCYRERALSHIDAGDAGAVGSH